MLRAFKCSFLVAIDESELEDYQGEFNLEEIKSHLSDKLIIDYDQDADSEIESVGFCSAEIVYDDLKELSREEVTALYDVSHETSPDQHPTP